MIAMNNVKPPAKLGKVQGRPLTGGSGGMNRIHSSKTINQMSDDTINQDTIREGENAVLGDDRLQSKSSLLNKAQNMLRNSKNSIESIGQKVALPKNQLEVPGGVVNNKIVEKYSARIMIVDDVIFNIDILKDILEKVLKVDVKNDVIEAYNGK